MLYGRNIQYIRYRGGVFRYGYFRGSAFQLSVPEVQYETNEIAIIMPGISSYPDENGILNDDANLRVSILCNGVDVAQEISVWDGQEMVSGPFYPATAGQRGRAILTPGTSGMLNIRFDRLGVTVYQYDEYFNGRHTPDYFRLPQSDTPLRLYINDEAVEFQYKDGDLWKDAPASGLSSEYAHFQIRTKTRKIPYPAIAKWQNSGGFGNPFLYQE